VFQRPPTKEELAAGRSFIRGGQNAAAEVKLPMAGSKSAWLFGYASYDSKTGEHGLDKVRPFPYLGQWKLQGGPEFPDNKNGFGWLQMRSTGGHAGGTGRCQVRRWTSPISGVIEISGELIHGSEIGDGIRSTLYLNQKERLGQWIAHNGKVDTGIKSMTIAKGDVIDFVVDAIQGGSYDGFNWNPLIVPIKATPSISGRTGWSPKRDFPRPPKVAKGKKSKSDPYGPWAQYVQVLLMSNEFVNIE
jgi:hypothetical protein